MLGKPKEVFHAHEADKVREIRQRLQSVIDYVLEENLTLPVTMQIEEGGLVATVTIEDAKP